MFVNVHVIESHVPLWDVVAEAVEAGASCAIRQCASGPSFSVGLGKLPLSMVKEHILHFIRFRDSVEFHAVAFRISFGIHWHVNEREATGFRWFGHAAGTGKRAGGALRAIHILSSALCFDLIQGIRIFLLFQLVLVAEFSSFHPCLAEALLGLSQVLKRCLHRSVGGRPLWGNRLLEFTELF
jgi:hypothetical protein